MKFAGRETAGPGDAVAEADDVVAMRSILARINGFLYRCRCDADYTMIFMTEAIGHLTGYPASDFIGNRVRSFVSITHPDDQKRIFEEVDAAILSREQWDIDYRLIARDGSIVWINEVGAAIHAADGSLEYLEGAVTNINDRKMIELQNEQLVSAVAQESAEIVATTGGIMEILKRLRMLAFNARIEAARAGETGLGFAVVAQEIKAMADQSTGLATRITESTNSLGRLLRGG